jgi:poly(3-hydroxybutyrate) depolymerase
MNKPSIEHIMRNCFKHRITAMLVLAVLLAAACRMYAQPGSLHTFVHESTVRAYWLYVPSTYDGKSSVPLVLALHGTGGSGQSHAESTRYDLLAERDTFILAHPSGFPYADPCPLDTCQHKWNNKFTTGPLGYPDAAFLLAVIDTLAAEYRIDHNRVYLSGFSNGASMAMRMACQHPETFAAVAAHSGKWLCSEDGVDGEAEFDCTPAERIPFQFSVGEREPIELTGRDTADVQCRLFWSASNACSTFHEETVTVGSRSVLRREYTDCHRDSCSPAMVTQYNTILGATHGWNEVNSELAWAFFQRFTRDCTRPTGIGPENRVQTPSRDFFCFPNPARDVLTIVDVRGDVTIRDVLGRIVWNGRIDGQTSISVSALIRGIYVLQSGSSVRMLVKQ